jgi:hypothetical protein
MKQKILQSSFLGILSGACGALVACALGLLATIFMLLLFSVPIEIDESIGSIFSRYTFSYVWLPGLMTGSFVGFLSGEWVATRPQSPDRNYRWALIGGMTSVTTFVLVNEFGDIVFIPSVIMVAVCGMIGGLVARFVYGMLQHRFLPELQIN